MDINGVNFDLKNFNMEDFHKDSLNNISMGEMIDLKFKLEEIMEAVDEHVDKGSIY